MGSRIGTTPLFQPGFKDIEVFCILQNRVYFRIEIFPGEGIINGIGNKDLYTVYISVVIDGDGRAYDAGGMQALSIDGECISGLKLC